MKIINSGRRSGKTTKAIELANSTGAYLICFSEEEKRRIREQCNRNPVSFEELNKYGMRGSFVRNVVVDNFDKYFEQRLTEAIWEILSPLDGLKIEAITLTESIPEVTLRVIDRMVQAKFIPEIMEAD